MLGYGLSRPLTVSNRCVRRGRETSENLVKSRIFQPWVVIKLRNHGSFSKKHQVLYILRVFSFCDQFMNHHDDMKITLSDGKTVL